MVHCRQLPLQIPGDSNGYALQDRRSKTFRRTSSNCAQELRDSRSRSRPQQFGLRRFGTSREEPPAQPFPSLTPRLPTTHLFIGLSPLVIRSGVPGLPLSNLEKDALDTRRKILDWLGYRIGAANEIAQEAVEVVDQPALIGDDRARFCLLKLKTACDPSHERLCVFGKIIKDAN